MFLCLLYNCCIPIFVQGSGHIMIVIVMVSDFKEFIMFSGGGRFIFNHRNKDLRVIKENYELF